MKEDVLEQIVDDYLQLEGYFTRHNLRFRPRADHPDYDKAKDCVSSDIDVVGIHPRRGGANKVWAVTCKSWQAGFNPRQKLLQMRGDLKNPKRQTWQHFRELWKPKWGEAFRDEIEACAKATSFTYVLAVTHLTGPWDAQEAEAEWSNDPIIEDNLRGNPLRFLDLSTMWSEVVERSTTTTASSEIGRLAQLLKASGDAVPR